MDSVTGTSVIPLNASSEDLDDVVESVTFYVDGVEFDSKKRNKNVQENLQNYSTSFDLGEWIATHSLPTSGGVFSLFAIPKD